MVTLHDASESATLADARNVDELFAIEDVDQNAIANFGSIAIAVSSSCGDLDGNFSHKLHRRKIVLRQMSAFRLVELGLFHKLDQTDLSRVVSVLRRRLAAGHDTR